MKTLTPKQLRQKIEELAAANPDKGAGCRYVDANYEPLCIVGQAVHDIDRDLFEELFASMRFTSSLSFITGASLVMRIYGVSTADELNDLERDPYAVFVRETQRNQDNGFSWGESVRHAQTFISSEHFATPLA